MADKGCWIYIPTNETKRNKQTKQSIKEHNVADVVAIAVHDTIPTVQLFSFLIFILLLLLIQARILITVPNVVHISHLFTFEHTHTQILIRYDPDVHDDYDDDDGYVVDDS